MDELDQQENIDATLPEEDESSGGKWAWNSWRVILIVLNAVIGLIAFEWAWYKTQRHREVIPELDKLMPAFRRRDTHKWRKWRFYPGAMTILVPRFFLSWIAGLLAVIQINLLLIGHDMSTPLPQTGCRKCLLRFVYNFWGRALGYIVLFTHYRHVHLTEEDVDYY